MTNIIFMDSLLAAVRRARILPNEISHEHDSVPIDGNLSTLINELVDHHGFKHHSSPSSRCTFLSQNENLQIELTSSDVPKHQGWRLRTVDAFARLRGELLLDTNFTQLQEYSIRDGDKMMAAIFRHKSGVCVQIVWRKEDIFPPKWLQWP